MQAVNRRPDDLRFLVQAANALVRAAAAEQGMSPQGKRSLAESMTELLDGLGEQFVTAPEVTTVRGTSTGSG